MPPTEVRTIAFTGTHLPEYTLDQKEIIKNIYEQSGVCMFRVIEEGSREELEEAVQCIWKNVILNQAWDEKPKVRSSPAKEEKVVGSDKFLRIVMGKKIKKYNKSNWIKWWPLYRHTGTPCDDSNFHTDVQWKYRSHPGIVELLSSIILPKKEGGGGGEAQAAIDYVPMIMKLPGQGPKGSNAIIMRNNVTIHGNNQRVSGKLMFTDSSISVVPYTHQDHTIKTHPNRLRTFKVPAGCMVIWNPRLLYCIKASKQDHNVEYGMYLGMHIINQDTDEKYRQACILHKTKFVLTETEDRKRSLETKTAPMLWHSSLLPIERLPLEYKRYPHLLKQQLQKFIQ